MTESAFLLWVRGPAFHAALAILVVGTLVQLLQILLLGRKKDYSVARQNPFLPALKTIFKRSLPVHGQFRFVHLIGYAFHIGFLISLLFFVPHIQLFRELTGFGWPGLPSPVVDMASLVALFALIALLVHRLIDPVKKLLSTFEDYLVWILSFLPLLTGYLAYHHLLLSYPNMLAWHILSVELLMVCLPFTKLNHILTTFIARWYNGAIAGRKGVQS
jgi:nitrate reductase gamma subunit